MWSDVSAASLLLLALLLLLSAFFSGSEAALLSVQRIRLRHMTNTKTAGAARVLRMVEHPERLLPPILLGNNLVNTGAAAISTSIALLIITDENIAVAVATGVVTVLLLVVGETIPKTLAARHPERFAIIVAPIVQGLSWVLRPISFLLQSISMAIAKPFGGHVSRQEVTEEEIKTIIQVGREWGAVEQGEAEMMRRVLEFGDKRVSELMTPRPEIVAIDIDASIRDFLVLYSENYHTRFPVIRGNIDDVAGTIGVKDVMRQLANGAQANSPAAQEVRPVRFVPETKTLDSLFLEMQSRGDQLVMIADEYGSVAGLVTFKRLVEGIVGRAENEEEEEGRDQTVLPLDENTVEIDGSISIIDANERLSLGLPGGQYETVAGFLLERLGRVPEPGAIAVFGSLLFAVVEMRGVRIVRVRISRSLTG